MAPQRAPLPKPDGSSGHTTTIIGEQKNRARPGVALVPGSRTHMTEEVASLLRNRLRVVGLILLIGTAVFLLRTLIAPPDEPPLAQILLHSTVTLLLASSCVALWSGWRFSIGWLRCFEGLIFGAFVIFFTYLHYHDLNQENFLRGVPIARHEFLIHTVGMLVALRWFVVLVLYGTFIPNTWQRCMTAVGLISVVPIALTFMACRDCPVLGPHLEVIVFNMLVVLAVGAATAIFGSYKVAELQKKAFEARMLGQYRLLKLLGSGGMGDVYLGEHMLLRRDCAIKTVRPDYAGDPINLNRFEREVQAMATLTHWNTVEVYDYGHSEDGTFYYVMEYLDGLTLQELVDRHGPLPAGRAIHFLRQIAGALREAHGIGLIHRDIKPSNVIICQRGGLWDVAKLLDFGLVQDVNVLSGDGKLTMKGAVLGSPPYISPEQARGVEPADPRSDLYGLGGLAYFLLTGHPPFRRDSALELMAAHLHEAVPPPHLERPEIPEDLEAVVLKCLRKNPADRFSDITAVDRALAACSDADDWSAEQAAAWWKEREAVRVHAPEDAPTVLKENATA